jgi:chaperonin GroES
MEKTTMNIRPLHDRVLVKRLEEETKTSGGIIIPDTAKEKPAEGIVEALGDGKRENGEIVPLSVKVGDKVLFGKWSGTEVKVAGVERLLIKEAEILAVIEE